MKLCCSVQKAHGNQKDGIQRKETAAFFLKYPDKSPHTEALQLVDKPAPRNAHELRGSCAIAAGFIQSASDGTNLAFFEPGVSPIFLAIYQILFYFQRDQAIQK